MKLWLFLGVIIKLAYFLFFVFSGGEGLGWGCILYIKGEGKQVEYVLGLLNF